MTACHRSASNGPWPVDAIATQALEHLAPAFGHLGEHRQSRAHILAALRVVGRQGRHRVRPLGLATPERGVEPVHRQGEHTRVSADLGQRAEPRLAIEGGVFDALGHDGPGRLLEAARDLEVRICQQRHEPRDRIGEIRTASGCFARCLLEMLTSCRQVRPVHGEAGQELGEGILCPVDRLGESPGEPPHLCRLNRVGDRALRAVDQIGVRNRFSEPRLSSQPGIQIVEPALARRVDEHPIDLGHRVVACRAVRLPPRGKRLGMRGRAVLQDLLHEHVGAVGGGGKSLEVSTRIEQTVRVVDAESIDEPLAHPADDLGVGRVEHPGHFDSDSREGRHHEEAPIVEVRRLTTPEDQLPVLPVEDSTQGRGIRRLLFGGGSLGEGKHVIEIAELPPRRPRSRAGVGGQLAGREHVVDIGAEDRQTHATPAEVPIDVERLGVPRITAPQQDVPPPQVLARVRDAHVIGDDVDQDAEARRPRGIGEAVQTLRRHRGRGPPAWGRPRRSRDRIPRPRAGSVRGRPSRHRGRGGIR